MEERTVGHTTWLPDGKVRAWCPECGWRKSWDGQGAANSAAVRHVASTGHRVQVYRSQWKTVSTGSASSKHDRT